MPEAYIRGNTIKYLRVPDEVLDKAKEAEAQMKRDGALKLAVGFVWGAWLGCQVLNTFEDKEAEMKRGGVQSCRGCRWVPSEGGAEEAEAQNKCVV